MYMIFVFLPRPSVLTLRLLGFDALLETIPAKFYYQKKQEIDGGGKVRR